jgi:ubiquinone/menaquinone biosynthesis C-methylase UbiE
MKEHAAFVGTVPDYYERLLVPFYFEPFADDLIRRLKPRHRWRALELACGTGVLTSRLLGASVDAASHLTATDLNEAMIDVARRKLARDTRVVFRQADAMALPFDDASFDIVICQFGWMFFPDKERAMREARRVLAREGQLIFNTWDALSSCPVAAEADAVIRSCFPLNPPTFYETPFGMHDAEGLRRMTESAGFDRVSIQRVSREGARLTAADAADGIIRGGPFAAQIIDRGGDVARVVATVAKCLAARFGPGSFSSPMSALVSTASSP